MTIKVSAKVMEKDLVLGNYTCDNLCGTDATTLNTHLLSTAIRPKVFSLNKLKCLEQSNLKIGEEPHSINGQHKRWGLEGRQFESQYGR